MIILSDDIIFRKAVIHLLNVELGKFAPAQDDTERRSDQ